MDPIVKVNGGTQFNRFALAFIGVSVLFSPILYQLVELSLDSKLYSHLLLIPLISGYLVWTKKDALPAPTRPKSTIASILAIAACASVGCILLAQGSSTWQLENYLAGMVFAYVTLVISIAFCFFGIKTLKSIQFPLAFLFCIIPLPLFIVDGLEVFFQYTSVEVAYWFITLMDIPVLRESWLVFRLPTITIQVASECSGIRSSLVLFIVSLVASDLFLRSQWKKLLLVLFIIPLAIARNALRVATIAAVCFHFGPEMIDSWIHQRGGPYFFALSMVPFMLVLYILIRSERTLSNKPIYEHN